MHRWAHKRMQVELMQTQPNAVERMHADVERRILLAHLPRHENFNSVHSTEDSDLDSRSVPCFLDCGGDSIQWRYEIVIRRRPPCTTASTALESGE